MPDCNSFPSIDMMSSCILLFRICNSQLFCMLILPCSQLQHKIFLQGEVNRCCLIFGGFVSGVPVLLLGPCRSDGPSPWPLPWSLESMFSIFTSGFKALVPVPIKPFSSGLPGLFWFIGMFSPVSDVPSSSQSMSVLVVPISVNSWRFEVPQETSPTWTSGGRVGSNGIVRL